MTVAELSNALRVLKETQPDAYRHLIGLVKLLTRP